MDIGLGEADEIGRRRVAVRVHVRTPSDVTRLNADGIGEPVGSVTIAFVVGDYRLEAVDDASTSEEQRKDR